MFVAAPAALCTRLSVVGVASCFLLPAAAALGICLSVVAVGP